MGDSRSCRRRRVASSKPVHLAGVDQVAAFGVEQERGQLDPAAFGAGAAHHDEFLVADAFELQPIRRAPAIVR